MGEESTSGLRLIAQHLAQVKLAAEENAYNARQTINKLESEREDLEVQLNAARSDIKQYQDQVKQLQEQNTYKALVGERDKWKTLVDTLRNDKKELKAELDAIRGQLGWNEKPEDAGGVSRRNSRASSTGSIKASESEMVLQLQGELNYLRNELEKKEVEVIALREKLDSELELKWERSHGPYRAEGPSGWQKSLLESFAEVLAPYPSAVVNPSTPMSPLSEMKRNAYLTGATNSAPRERTIQEETF